MDEKWFLEVVSCCTNSHQFHEKHGDSLLSTGNALHVHTERNQGRERGLFPRELLLPFFLLAFFLSPSPTFLLLIQTVSKRAVFATYVIMADLLLQLLAGLHSHPLHLCWLPQTFTESQSPSSYVPEREDAPFFFLTHCRLNVCEPQNYGLKLHH